MADKPSSGSAKKKNKNRGNKPISPSTASKQSSATDAVKVAPSASSDCAVPDAAYAGQVKQATDVQCTKVNEPEKHTKDTLETQVVAVQTLLDNTKLTDDQTDISSDATNATAADAPKSKAQLRAERRAIQEAQRAQKAANKVSGQPNKESSGKPVETAQAKLDTGAAQSTGSVNSKKIVVVKGQASGVAGNTNTTNVKGQSGGGAGGANTTNIKGQSIGGGSGANSITKKQDQSLTAVTGPKDAKIRVPDSMQVDDEKVVRRQSKKLDKQNVPQRPSAGQKRVNLFRHLVQYERNTDWIHSFQHDKVVLHRAIWKLGLQYMEGTVCGSNARCIALLTAMKEVIADYKTPPNTELSRDLEIHIRPFIGFLNQCRPLSVSMGNAIKYLKHHISHIPSGESDLQAKQTLALAINNFVRERILLAGDAISQETCSSIRNGDVILIYSCSSLVRKVLRDAHKKGIQFSVIVADGRPMLEGRVMLRRLVNDGIKCSYVLINAVSYVMHEVTKVLLGAHALLANGFVMSRVGSSQVALIAKTYNVPVLVCCETYKFCERVQTDSFVFNELGDPDDLTAVNNGRLSGWRSITPLHVLNVVYDVTPAELLSAVVTELGSIPSTSVPVVLRVKYSES